MRREGEFRFGSIELCGNFQQEVSNSVLEFRRKVKARAVLLHKSKKSKLVCGMDSLTWKKGKQRRGAGHSLGKYAFGAWEEGRSESEKPEDSSVTTEQWAVDF